MRAILLCMAILLAMGIAGAVVTEVGSIRGFVYGSEPNSSYDNWISHVSEGDANYDQNVYAPWDLQSNGFGDFRIPDQLELDQWNAVIMDFLALDLHGAQARIDTCGFPYEVVQFQDTDSGRLLYMLRELLNDDFDANNSESPALHELGSFDYGWGLYIYDPYASRPMIVNAPHPCDDYPSPVMALEAFLTWDARFLMIAGAGREVAYTPPYNSNNRSISDPSRYEAHPFNYAYYRFADQIRALTGRIEFSAQIHTYDWDKYSNKPSVMLSAGNQRWHPALPIRDNSRSKNDILNRTPWIVIPAGSIGNNADVTVYDYYSVYNYSPDPVIYDHDGTPVTIRQNTDLPGASSNVQMGYTQQDNLYDVYSPFFHIEMDELPQTYDHSISTWKWFYGFDAETGTWDIPHRFTRFIAFYMPWVNSLDAVLDDLLLLDNGSGPSNPENLRISSYSSTYFSVQFSWERSYDWDFDSYEMVFRYLVDGEAHYIVMDRHSHPELAWQALQSFAPSMLINQTYYVRIRARDKHGGFSAFSNEVKFYRGGASLSSIVATPLDNQVMLQFSSSLQNIHGFKIFRAVDGSNFETLATWSSDPSLLCNPEGTYSYSDTRVQNGRIYRYRVGWDYLSGGDCIDWRTRTVSPYKAYWIRLKNDQSGAQDDLLMGINPLALDDLDSIDITRNPTGNSLAIVSWLPGETTMLSKDIKRSYSISQSYKVWELKTLCSIGLAPLSITADPEILLSSGGDLLLLDEAAGIWHDLRDGPYVWTSTSTAYKFFKLYWGYQAPRFEIPTLPDFAIQQGDNHSFSWQTVNPNRLQSISLSLVHSTGEHQIAQGLPANAMQYSHQAILAPLLSARLKVTGLLSDGSSVSALSSWCFDVIPASLSYAQPAGLSLISIPNPAFDLDLASFAGSQADAWTTDAAGAWQSTQSVSFGSAHLIRHPQAWSFATASMPNTQVFSAMVSPGWNTLPNPHYHRYHVSDLRFIYQAGVLNYTQALAVGLTIARVSLLDRGSQIAAEIIPPQSGFRFLWTGSEPALILLDPFQHAALPLIREEIWSLRLRVEDGYMMADAIELGSADSGSDGLDILYDLPKPPALPVDNLRLCFTLQQNAQEHTLQSEYKGLYPFYDDHAKTWNFRLETPNNVPLRFSLEGLNFPPEYSVELILNGNSTMIPHGAFVWVDPGTAGAHYGSLVVRSHPYSPGQSFRTEHSGFSTYPNPFGQQVFISLDASGKEPLRLTVYNLRGQKVRNLYDGKPGAGKLSLTWDGCDDAGRQTSAGVYFIRVSSPSGSYHRKILRMSY